MLSQSTNCKGLAQMLGSKIHRRRQSARGFDRRAVDELGLPAGPVR